MSDGQQTNGEHLREIAEKLRRLAQQTGIVEAREELLTSPISSIGWLSVPKLPEPDRRDGRLAEG